MATRTSDREPGRLSNDLSQLRRLLDQMTYNQALATSSRLLAQAEAVAKRPASEGQVGILVAGAHVQERCFSLRKAARYAGRSTAAIAFAIRSGALKASRFGRNWRIRPENMNEWIDAHRG